MFFLFVFKKKTEFNNRSLRCGRAATIHTVLPLLALAYDAISIAAKAARIIKNVRNKWAAYSYVASNRQ